MKVNWLYALATVIVASVGGSASTAWAQTYAIGDANAPVRMASHGCDACGQAAGDCGCDDACGCDDGCDDGCEAVADEPIRLFPELPGGFTVTGWVDAGATLNGHNPPSNYNGPVTFNDRQELMMNQAYAVIQREIDTSDCCFDVGGRVDILYGTDYIFTQAIGLELERDGTPGWNNRTFYGLALPQMYAEFGYNDLSVKVGHFYTIIGYEVVTAPDNFFYSHAYTMQYGEPFTHTGIMTSYAATEQLTLLNGIHNGWNVFDRGRERLAYLGGATWKSSDEQISLAATTSIGDEANANNVFTNRSIVSLVATLQLTEKLSYVIQHDNAWQKDFFFPGADAEWYGLNQYLFYDINDCWKAGLRAEWFRDDDGVRVTGVRATNPIAGESFVGNFYEVSAGLNWMPNANLKVRPEIRFDWFNNEIPNAVLPYNDGNDDFQFTAACDAIVIW